MLVDAVLAQTVSARLRRLTHDAASFDTDVLLFFIKAFLLIKCKYIISFTMDFIK